MGNVSVYLSEEIEEIEREAKRQGCNVSRLLQEAWVLARDRIRWLSPHQSPETPLDPRLEAREEARRLFQHVHLIEDLEVPARGVPKAPKKPVRAPKTPPEPPPEGYEHPRSGEIAGPDWLARVRGEWRPVARPTVGIRVWAVQTWARPVREGV